ncbi:site-specific DNA-methyltransferase [Deinococcus wulumuqiensis]
MTDSPRQGTKRQRDLKLELTWVGKDHRPRLEPRILLEDPTKNYHAAARVTEADQFENMLIFGDNLLALQSLATDPRVKGKVKCIYIDPPYNTGSAFEHYDDGMEHSLWLSMMRERLELLRELLHEDGFIFVQIDNNEAAYLKVLLDEIFGRNCFINDIIWKRRGGSANPNNRLNNVTDYILWYSKRPDLEINQLYSRDDEVTQEYIKERFKGELNGRKYMLAPIERNAKLGIRETLRYEYNGYVPEFGWMMSRENLERFDREGKLHWNSKGRPNRRVFEDEYQGQPIGNLWTDIKVINPMALERLNFDGQKPEALLQRILQLSTNSGDLVLDSFGGSGTTGAVAHKMGRRWIMVELGEHAHTHIIPRMQKVIDGTDQGGISQAVGWKGGGGFRYFKLAPTLIKKDRRGNEIINPEYNAEMLAEACCKLKGFAFEPSASRELWWQQGRSSERDFLFVTTRFMDEKELLYLSEEVGPERTLLVLVKAYDRQGEVFDNLTIEKIPDSVLHLAEWDKDDYSLKVENLPKAAPDKELVTTAQRAERRGSRNMAGVPDLFAGTGEDS